MKINKDLQDKYPWRFNVEWKFRMEFIASQIKEGESVLDLGGGMGNLQKYLNDNEYTSIDFEKWTDETIVANFNKREFPALPQYDVLVCGGLLEYIHEAGMFLESIKQYGGKLIITYRPAVRGASYVLERANEFSYHELEDLLKQSGWIINSKHPILGHPDRPNEVAYICKKI